MGMFRNYNTQVSKHYPDNMTVPSNRVEVKTVGRNVQVNVLGEFVGYTWSWGEKQYLPIEVNPLVKVESTAIIYTAEGESPDGGTEGFIGQYAYNTYDLVCWVCEGAKDDGEYVWNKQETLSVPEKGEKDVRLYFFHDLSARAVTASFVDHFGNEVYASSAAAADSVQIPILKKAYSTLRPNTYDVYVYLSSASTSQMITSMKVSIGIGDYTGDIGDDDSDDDGKETYSGLVTVETEEGLPKEGKPGVLYITITPSALWLWDEGHYETVGFDHGDPSRITGGGAFEHRH